MLGSSRTGARAIKNGTRWAFKEARDGAEVPLLGDVWAGGKSLNFESLNRQIQSLEQPRRFHSRPLLDPPFKACPSRSWPFRARGAGCWAGGTGALAFGVYWRVRRSVRSDASAFAELAGPGSAWLPRLADRASSGKASARSDQFQCGVFPRGRAALKQLAGCARRCAVQVRWIEPRSFEHGQGGDCVCAGP